MATPDLQWYPEKLCLINYISMCFFSLSGIAYLHGSSLNITDTVPLKSKSKIRGVYNFEFWGYRKG